MLQIKSLSKQSIPKALIRAKHYRLLNEPWQAESICRDVLTIEPTHQLAILLLVLSISDQFGSDKGASESEAKEMCDQLTSEYEQKYYQGIIAERSGMAALNRSTPRASYIAYDYYRNAMDFYDEAQKVQPKDNPDTVLRWNACLRAIQKFKLEPSHDEDRVYPF